MMLSRYFHVIIVNFLQHDLGMGRGGSPKYARHKASALMGWKMEEIKILSKRVVTYKIINPQHKL